MWDFASKLLSIVFNFWDEILKFINTDYVYYTSYGMLIVILVLYVLSLKFHDKSFVKNILNLHPSINIPKSETHIIYVGDTKKFSINNSIARVYEKEGGTIEINIKKGGLSINYSVNQLDAKFQNYDIISSLGSVMGCKYVTLELSDYS